MNNEIHASFNFLPVLILYALGIVFVNFSIELTMVYYVCVTIFWCFVISIFYGVLGK